MERHRGLRARLSARAFARLRFAAGLVLAAAAFYALNGQRNELIGASARLANLRVGWLLLAIAAEVVSFVCFAALQRRLLGAGGVEVDLGYMTGVTFAAGAIADSVPAGPAFATVYAYRRYRRRGASDALAGWTLLATLVCAALALALVATAGVAIAEQESATYDLVGIVLAVLVISAVADAVVWQRRWMSHVLVWALLATRRVIGRPRRHGLVVVEELLGRLGTVRPSRRDLVATVGFALGNWLFDCGCLAASFAAVDAPVPWRALLLAYGAGQLAANLPITPGGLGVVEGSLTVALVAFGGGEVSTVAAVLCYRIVSFWGFLPLGWGSLGALALGDRRRARAMHPSVAADRLERSGAIEVASRPLEAIHEVGER